MFNGIVNLWNTRGPGSKKHRKLMDEGRKLMDEERAQELFMAYDLDDWGQFEVLALSGASPYVINRSQPSSFSIISDHYNLMVKLLLDMDQGILKATKALDILFATNEFTVDMSEDSYCAVVTRSGRKKHEYNLLQFCIYGFDGYYNNSISEKSFKHLLDKADELGKLRISRESLVSWSGSDRPDLRKIFIDHIKDDYGITDQNKPEALTL